MAIFLLKQVVYVKLSMSELYIADFHLTSCERQVTNLSIVYCCLLSEDLRTSSYQCCCRPTSSYQCLCSPTSSYQCRCRPASPGIPPSAVSSPPPLPWCRVLSAAGLPSPSANSQTPGDCPQTRPSDADTSQGQTGPEREEIFFVFCTNPLTGLHSRCKKYLQFPRQLVYPNLPAGQFSN